MKRYTQEIRRLTINMVNKNMDNISKIRTFLNVKNRNEFSSLIRKRTKLIPALGNKIYKIVESKLKYLAQKQQYGQFIDDTDIEMIDHEFHHILKVHIKEGNLNTIKNVFRFYGRIIHYDDTEQQTAKCRSLERRKERASRLANTSKTAIQSNSSSAKNVNDAEDKNLWTMKQIYIQSQLDLVHCYLCHTDWKDRVNRYIQQKQKQGSDEEELEDEEQYELEEADHITMVHHENKNKYITSSYGFGVDHRLVHFLMIIVLIRIVSFLYIVILI